jgi:hypothetical protein
MSVGPTGFADKEALVELYRQSARLDAFVTEATGVSRPGSTVVRRISTTPNSVAAPTTAARSSSAGSGPIRRHRRPRGLDGLRRSRASFIMSNRPFEYSNALRPLTEALAADGYGLEIEESSGGVRLTISAGATACPDCLIPKDLFASMAASRLGTTQVEVRYPGEAGNPS